MKFMPKNNVDAESGRSIDKAVIGVKEGVAILLFVASHAVSWGIVINGNSERDIKINALSERITKQEEVNVRLMNEVTKVSRDTEWIRSYLNSHKVGTPP